MNSANREISLDGRATAEAKRSITTWLEQGKDRPRGGQLQAAGLAVFTAEVLGRAVPGLAGRG